MNKPHKIIAMDPGETIGAVYLEVSETSRVCLVGHHQRKHTFSEAIHWLYDTLALFSPKAVVIEDYRIYASHAGHHVGARLYTPELIGAFAALCELNSVPLVRLPANKKGRWPLARLKNKFPQYARVPTPHALDALRLGLAYLEDGGAEFPRR